MDYDSQTAHKGCTDLRIAWNVLAGTLRYVSLRERGCTQGVVADYFSRLARIYENEYAVDFALHILIGLSATALAQASAFCCGSLRAFIVLPKIRLTLCMASGF